MFGLEAYCIEHIAIGRHVTFGDVLYAKRSGVHPRSEHNNVALSGVFTTEQWDTLRELNEYANESVQSNLGKSGDKLRMVLPHEFMKWPVNIQDMAKRAGVISATSDLDIADEAVVSSSASEGSSP